MTSSVCHRFVQNAWKKERCSNCFKSKEEHVSIKREMPVSRRPLMSNRSRGIMKTSTTSARRKRTVSFKPDLTEIIGFGGEDWSENEESDNDDNSSPESSDHYSTDEEDKNLEKLTKSNTEHNANITPLPTTTTTTTTTTDRRRTFTQLMLGQPQKDSEGKKQTLLVSVTPFGQDDTDRTPPRRLIKSHIPIAKNKEILVEARPKVVLTSYSKNRDSPELLNGMKQLENKRTKDADAKDIKPKIEPKIETKIETVAEDEQKTVDSSNIKEFGQEDKENVICNNGLEIVETVNEARIVKNIEDEISKEIETPEAVIETETALEPVKDSTESSEESADSIGPAESREQAGEPDGRADPDVPCEPPALPLSPPPPLVAPPPRTSFLHSGSPRSTTPDKLKVPTKSENKTPQLLRNPTSELPPLPSPVQDLSKLSNKRRAPDPPPTTIEDHQIQELPEMIPDSPLIRSCPAPEIEPTNPEPAPRKTISSENLISIDKIEKLEKPEEKRKDKTRSRFSLKKFLRVGGSGSKSLEKNRLEEVKEKISPTPKPRLVIVHPLELNGSAVEVVTPPVAAEDGPPFHFRDVTPPAPPPRNLTDKRLEEPKPPPKSEDLLRKQRQQSLTSPSKSSSDNLYANLGEVRSGLAPSKPQRTASMREREEQQQHLQQLRRKPEHVYERVNPPRRHSDESHSSKESPGRLKQSKYSGSESNLDLELYSPCGSYYGSECEISEGGCSRPCRLRSRKGRSIVHKNLEDNYGAVVVANHEALAQVLEHLHSTTVVQPALRGLQSAPVLHWSDFSIVDPSSGVAVGRRAFYHALWGAHHITVSVSKDQGSMHKHPFVLGAFSLVPVTEFSDLIPTKFVPNSTASETLIQASVAIFPWMQVETIHSFGAAIKTKNGAQYSQTEINRDSCFILLQFVNSLKNLQAQGIEEVPLSLSNFILCHDVDRETHHRLCLLQGFSEEVNRTDEKLGSLCQCATTALEELFPATKLASLLKTLLKKESAMSLSQVKSILEFSLWGPSDVALGVPIKDRELALQRWLDLERATVLHGLVGTRVQLSVLEECHLMFLVRSSAKMMCEASLLLESNGVS